MKRNWEQEGYLEGLTTEGKEIVGGWLDQVEFDDMLNDYAKEVIHAVIRSIYSGIKKNTMHPKIYTYEKLMAHVDVVEIVNTYDNYCERFQPEAKLWLPNLDAYAETSVLFCDNYRLGLYNKIDEDKR